MKANRNATVKKNPADSLAKILNENIFNSPYDGCVAGQEFRSAHCYNSEVDEFFWKNLRSIEEIYSSPRSPLKTSDKKRFLKLKEIKAYVMKMGLILDKGKVNECFFKSLVTDVDPVKN
jgi:hypothetical protein